MIESGRTHREPAFSAAEAVVPAPNVLIYDLLIQSKGGRLRVAIDRSDFREHKLSHAIGNIHPQNYERRFARTELIDANWQ